MSTGPVSQFDIPEFTAWPVTSFDDATVFLHANGGQIPGCPIDQTVRRGDFQRVRDFLLGTTIPDLSNTIEEVDWPRAGPPRLSAAGEVRIRREPDDRLHLARGLACFSDRRRSVSVTLRSVACPGQQGDKLFADGDPHGKATACEPSVAPNWLNPAWLASPFTASTNRGSDDKKFWFTVEEQCRVLFECIFGGSDRVGRTAADGLVVLTGATNSSKTQVARGLIDKYLRARPRGGKVRRPHLVTFEDPIEAFYVEPAEPGDLKLGREPPPEMDIKYGELTAEQQRAVYESLRRIPRAVLARWYQVRNEDQWSPADIDYTPREKGKDVHGLTQAFADALRQTPSVFFVGEVRDPKEWIEVLEFAGTGHLVVTTAHAGSLLEAMVKILSAVGARTPDDRRRYAARIKAVVHLRPWLEQTGAADVSVRARTLLLPAVWRQTPAGLAGLSKGLGALKAECPRPGREADVSCLGRRWFARQLLFGSRDRRELSDLDWADLSLRLSRRKGNQYFGRTLSLDGIRTAADAMDELAQRYDLRGE